MNESSAPGTCREAVDAMSELLDGALAPGDAAHIGAHLAGCVRCRELLGSLQALPGAIRELSRGPEPDDLEARILAALGL